jgi:hypothetical protein
VTGRVDHAKARRLARVGTASDPDRMPTNRSLRGWRTEYPETFPVTVTQLAEVDAILTRHGITLEAIRAERASVTETVEASQAPGQRRVLPFRRPVTDPSRGDASHGTETPAE